MFGRVLIFWVLLVGFLCWLSSLVFCDDDVVEVIVSECVDV